MKNGRMVLLLSSFALEQEKGCMEEEKETADVHKSLTLRVLQQQQRRRKNKPLLAKQPNGEMHIVTKRNNNPRGAGCQTGFRQQQIRIITVPFGWCKQLVLTEVVAAIIAGCTSHPVNVNKEKSPLRFSLLGLVCAVHRNKSRPQGRASLSHSSILARTNT